MPPNQPSLPKRTIPDLPKRLFWEYQYDKIDWQKEAAAIIQRVMERGTPEEWQELVRFYGERTVLFFLKNELKYLPAEVIPDVCNYFKLAPTELKCYTKIQSRLPR